MGGFPISEENDKFVRAVEKFVSNFGIDRESKEVARAMSIHLHRTLQQNFTRLCIAWFLRLAQMEEEGSYDLRNEASCKLAKTLKPILEETGLPMV